MSRLLAATLILALAVYHVDATTIKVDERVDMKMKLQREQHRHVKALARITSKMTMTSAMEMLHKKAGDKPALMTLVQAALQQGHRDERAATNLRAKAGATPATGYSGVDKAKEMLNEMIEEVQLKYDMELQNCCDWDEEKSVEMESTREAISMFNAQAAEARQAVLDANGIIHMCETKLPELKDTLNTHNRECKEEIAALEAQLAIVMADISVMDTILGMTNCDKPLALVSCMDSCSGKSFVSFGHDALHQKVAALKSDSVREMLGDSLSEAYGEENTTNATTTWVPVTIPEMTVTRTGPCKEPVPADKRTGKCSMNSNPNCAKMQEKFKYIQAGIEDKRDELQEQLAKLRTDCESTRMNLEAQISDFETKLKDAQTALAGATKKQNDAESSSRLENQRLHKQLTAYASMTTSCHTNYETYEGEECGLKKIRGELYKMQGQDHPFFQDCVVSDWLPGECSASCAGGVMTLTRSIVTQPYLGAACPLLSAQKPCNEHKCPIDCRLRDWQGWSGCTAECGGGLMERTRDIEVEPEHGGEPCGETSEAISCNLQACDRDCVLSDWGPWSECSKDCDSGTTVRVKNINEPAIGDGTCPLMHSGEREQTEHCNSFKCERLVGQPNLQCQSKADIILVIDGSGSLGQRGWDASVKAGAAIARGFGAGSRSDVRLACLLYSYNTQWVSHFTDKTDEVATKIEALTWPRSLTYTAKALNTAAAELSLGRADAPSVVILLTDGRPMSMKRTKRAAEALRTQSRLMTVPVTRWAPLAQAKKWASYPKEDNFLPLKQFSDLTDADEQDQIIADVCPEVSR